MRRTFPYLPSLACVAGAVVLAAMERGGWGWFLLAALVVYPLRND